VFKSLIIGVAIFGLGWGASFGAGAAWGRRSVASPVQAQIIPAGQLGAGGAAAGGAAVAGGGAPGAGAPGAVRVSAAGTVERLEGQTLVVAGPNGQTSRVTLTDQTQITKQGPGSPADLTAGSRVAVAPQGQPAPDGTVTAAAVTILSEGAAPQGQGQGQQGPGQGQGGQRRPGQAG
jgi:hypothetical protein